MTDDLTREHERALLACALLGGAHTARSLLDIVQAPMLADAMLARACPTPRPGGRYRTR